MGIILKEHISYKLTLSEDVNLVTSNRFSHLLYQPTTEIKPRQFKKERGQEYLCFECKISATAVELRSGYFVGIDWLTKDRYIHVEPKLNTVVATSFDEVSSSTEENPSDADIETWDIAAVKNLQRAESEIEVDIIAMLMDLMSHPEVAQHSENLLLVDWEAPEISINQQQDLLTPFLVVQFLKLLQGIVRKGLKKSYYRVQENLRNRVKGKILVDQQIKHNVFKNRFTNTVCDYQVFGEDSIENRFLKKVFLFCTQYIENNHHYFKGTSSINGIINYIRPSFEHINTDVDVQDINHLKYNPFFRSYKESIKVGQHILKRFSYNMSKATSEQVSTPPFWIDMPKMFELFVFKKFLNDNPDMSAADFNYQFSTYGNALDFLICKGNEKIVVDAKYKLHYNYGQIHQDIRQLAGYARLIKVKDQEPKINGEIPCLIIYPRPIGNDEIDSVFKIADLLSLSNGTCPIEAYDAVYKLGISLPTK